MKATSFLLAIAFIIGVHEMRHSVVSSIHGRDLLATLKLMNCDKFSKRLYCAEKKYRTIDGSCNNLCNITKGAIFTELIRTPGLHPPTDYDDPILFTPRFTSVDNRTPLTNARTIRRIALPSNSTADLNGPPPFTHLTMTWGQFIDHDIALTEMEEGECGTNLEECPIRPECIGIDITGPGDQLLFNPTFKCIPHRRSFRTKAGEQVNIITHYIDGSMVYGSTIEVAEKLRAFRDGLLDVRPYPIDFGRDEILPPNPDTFCLPNATNEECWLGGDIRVNENHALATMHTLWVREHNRIARALKGLNPQWDDETLYQQARRIVIAEIQHIHYNEWLRVFYDDFVLREAGILLEEEGKFFEGYDPLVDPSLRNGFATAAYRMGHSLVRDEFFLLDAIYRKRGFFEAGSFIPTREFYNPDQFFRPGNNPLAGIMKGLMAIRAHTFDFFFVPAITDLLRLDGEGNTTFTIIDLPATNIQRCRDHGCPAYVEFRKACGLSVPISFDQLHDIPLDQRQRLRLVYRDVRDIDLFVGGMSENHAPGSQMGATFTCLITRQFAAMRIGDRFWYEREHEQGFSAAQLAEIRKVTFAKVACQNMEEVAFAPKYAFRPSKIVNSCGSLPSMDLSVFQEEEGEAEEEEMQMPEMVQSIGV